MNIEHFIFDYRFQKKKIILETNSYMPVLSVFKYLTYFSESISHLED